MAAAPAVRRYTVDDLEQLPDDTFSGEDVLPGFALRIRDIVDELAAIEALDEPGG